MEMRAREDVGISQDITPLLSPLAHSLYDSFLLSHCSSCFSPLCPTFSPNVHRDAPSPSFLYCSHGCSAAAAPLHVPTAERHLLLLHPHRLPRCYASDTSDLRAALRLLYLFQSLGLLLAGDRIGGLLTNRNKFICPENSDFDGDEIVARIREGGKAMALARSMRDGVEFSGEPVLEEAVLCIVVTNAVEVQVNGGRPLGIAVYDVAFSWINHSCSPNACYRFLFSSPVAEPQQLSGEPRLQIISSGQDIENAVCSCGELRKDGYGPRIVVRSIKAIKKDEEVTIAYTDLLQPKDVVAVDHDCTNLSSDHTCHSDVAIRELADYMDDAITEYLSGGDPESCRKKLEDILSEGTLDEQFKSKKGNMLLNFKLRPYHYLSLNAYTTLASAYKVHAGYLLASHPEKNGRQLEAFNMTRTSAAYSLLLAVATHHLFLSEPSLIACAANFWTNAGESLLSIARSSLWNYFVEWDSSLLSHDCFNCSLTSKFSSSLVYNEAENSDLEDISREFHNCITKIAPEIWSFLRHGCHYLETFKDPTDFSWPGKTADAWNSSISGGRTGGGYEPLGYSNQERVNLFKLGVHCLLYGGHLLSICYDGHSYRTRHIENFLHEETKRD
ncbi:protein SET DOMAIN GROUP 41 isoform X2 [Malania oleifera]|uniref:protein SET DOMAIN GROUP 41 isoform X2 n=1 Tax=Malania oleifera TaxID=397392 RepID=UPI0025AE7031|nr:protein SET DOMAIN GROUP 41 isoform X2 [Malania oleifera]